jgi:hypothetical protein
MVVVAGCAMEVTTTPINAPPSAMTARTPDSVELFASGPPTRTHVDVALIQAQPNSTTIDDSAANLIAALRARAASIGCDGLVVTQIDRAQGRQLQSASGTCVVWTR